MDDTQPQARNTYSPGNLKWVYTIVERKDKEKKYWVRIGTARVNNDCSINVYLDASPTNGMLHIRDADFSGYGPRRDAEAAERAGGAA